MNTNLDLYNEDLDSIDKEYRVEVKVKNNLLYKAMIEAGYNSASSLACASTISLSIILNYLNLKASPYRKKYPRKDDTYLTEADYYLTESADDLSKFLKKSVTQLFPKEHLYIPLANNKGVTQVSFEQIENLVNNKLSYEPNYALEPSVHDLLNNAIDTLKPREQEVLKMMYWDNMCLEEVGNKFGVTRETIRQIQVKAIRRLKHRTQHEGLATRYHNS